MKRILAGALLAIAVWLVADAPRAGAETALDKYRSLLQEKRSLMRENAALQLEAALAATKASYVLFHLDDGRLEFRVRGKTFKSYNFSHITLDERGRRPADAEAVWKVMDKPLTVVEVQGAHPELIPPDPNTQEEGQLFSDPNQLAAQTGAGLVRSDAGVLGVDVPTDYYIKFEEDVVFHIRTPKTQTFREKATDRLSEIAGDMRAGLSSLLGRPEIEVAHKPRVELYLTTDPDTAKFLHYSLLPGEKVVPVAPPPPPILLVASSRETPPSGGGAAPSAR